MRIEPLSPPRGLIAPEVLRELSELRPARSLGQIALEWSSILLAALVAERIGHPIAYLIAVVFIGTRQHALAILVHDGAHHRLVRDGRLNDVVSDVFCAWPLLLLTTRSYRHNHTPHHLRLCTERDPDWQRKQTPDWSFPQSKRRLTWTLVRHAIGLGLLDTIAIIRKISAPHREIDAFERRLNLARLAYFAGLIATLTVTGGWTAFAMYWLVPYLTWLQLLLRFRSIAEHCGIPAREGWVGLSRTTVTSWFGALFIAPVKVGYHVEHHLYPSVPFYNLPALHRALMANPEYAGQVHITRGYHRVLLECVR